MTLQSIFAVVMLVALFVFTVLGPVVGLIAYHVGAVQEMPAITVIMGALYVLCLTGSLIGMIRDRKVREQYEREMEDHLNNVVREQTLMQRIYSDFKEKTCTRIHWR